MQWPFPKDLAGGAGSEGDEKIDDPVAARSASSCVGPSCPDDPRCCGREPLSRAAYSMQQGVAPVKSKETATVLIDRCHLGKEPGWQERKNGPDSAGRRKEGCQARQGRANPHQGVAVSRRPAEKKVPDTFFSWAVESDVPTESPLVTTRRSPSTRAYGTRNRPEPAS